MSYSGYGGNPYRDEEAGYGGRDSNPYEGTASGYGGANPYGGEAALSPPPPLQHEESNYSQGSHYSAPSAVPTNANSAPLSQQDFIKRVEGARNRINQLTSNISEIAAIHQRLLSSTDERSSAQLEDAITRTQILNTGIKDEIKFLERDASREPTNKVKKTQVKSVKQVFENQLREYHSEESTYSQRYREAIARQYRIINPDASEQEVNEAANADWGNGGVFQQALQSNRSGQASSVLGAVRARHNDIQRIEKTMRELNQLFEQLAEEVTYQEQAVVSTETAAIQVNEDTTQVNKELDKGIVHAKRARRLKWWVFWIVVLIICIIALALGLYFGLK
ncbi:t-SNARE [Dendryphion nanum]|uniref:t-SNARE n=1 Tax=Dendryphion nanum TaxID=256645 RepID=A0A9P9E9V8_9PLEO|nr:t-SNARE [Dendryphion nanum]